MMMMVVGFPVSPSRIVVPVVEVVLRTAAVSMMVVVVMVVAVFIPGNTSSTAPTNASVGTGMTSAIASSHVTGNVKG